MQLPSENTVRSIVSAYAQVRVDFGHELGERPLVLPNGDFFPDTFRGDGASVEALVRRLQGHAGMMDIPIRTRVIGDASATECSSGQGKSSCGSCGPTWLGTDESGLVDTGDEWQLSLTPQELAHPVALVTRLSRVLGTIFLVETQGKDQQHALEPALLVDLLAVGLGFGALLLEGAYVYSKSCGGPSVAKLTHLGVDELALCVALFAADKPKALRKARSCVGTTQSALLAEAEDWLAGNRGLTAQLRRAPELLTTGVFDLGKPRTSWFSWFGNKRADDDLEPMPTLPKPRTQKPVDDGLKALVEDALAERN